MEAASCRGGSKIGMMDEAQGGSKRGSERLKAKPQFGGDDVLGTWHRSLDYLARMAFRW